MGVIENMREVAELVKQIGDIELNRKIVHLEKEVHELTRDKIRLETKLHEAETLLRKKQDLKFIEPFYYAEGDEIPHCPACWSAKDIAVHLLFVSNRENETRWDCPHCKHNYYDKKDRSVKSSGPARIQPFSGGRNNWLR
jgi:hypothetical protein